MYSRVISTYEWVKENIRYAYPHWVNAEVTKQTKKGHCGAKSEVLVSMLRDLGIEAQYVEGRNTGLKLLPIMRLKGMDVHFWVEAKVDNEWLCLDPSPDSGIVRLWGDTRPGTHLGNPDYIVRWDEIPHWYKEGYNMFLFWPFRFLTNIELLILRFVWRFPIYKRG